MKTIFTTVLIGTIMLTLLNACYTVQVNKLETNMKSQNPKSLKKNGILYALPKKEFQLLVTIEETYLEPSSLINDEKYLDAIKVLKMEDDIIKNKDSSFKILSIDLLERSVPDSEHVYFVSLLGDKAPFRKAEHSFNFDSGLFLSESSTKTEDQTFQFVEKSASAITKLILAGVAPESMLGVSNLSKGFESEFDYFDPSANKSKFEASVKKKSVVETLLERIRFLQEKRDAILGGTFNSAIYENNQTSLLLEQIKVEEQRIIELLQGKKTVKSSQYYIDIDVTQNESTPFHFSKKKGLAMSKESGTAVTVTFGTNDIQHKVDTFYSSKENHINRKGIYYRIPFTTELKVYYGSKCYLRTSVSIPQLGNVAFLPSKIALRSNNISYSLDAKTGALIKFQANGEGLNSEEVSNILKSASEIPDQEITKIENLIKMKELQLKLDSLDSIKR